MNGLECCAHCEAKGTCRNGPNNLSCQVCVAAWRMRYPKSLKEGVRLEGLKCSSCWGKGKVEPPGAVKWDYKTPAYLAGGLGFCSFVLLLALIFQGNTESLSKGLVFVGTLLGSITGYYFGGQRKISATSADNRKAGEVADTETAEK
jgi:hypothetical protein